MQEQGESMEKASKKFDSVVGAAKDAASSLVAATEELEAHNRGLVDDMTKLQNFLEFNNEVKAWLKGQKD
jgi:hypothetical protein